MWRALIALVLTGCVSRGTPIRTDMPFALERPPSEPAATIPPVDLTHGGEGPVRVGLGDAIRAIVLGDPEVRAALEDVEIAQADHETAAATPNPTLGVAQTMVAFPGSSFSPTRQGGPPQLDITIGYTLDDLLFGKRTERVATARASVDTALAEHADVVRRRVVEAIGAYYDVVEAAALRTLATEEVAAIERLHDQMVAAGEGADTTRVDNALLDARRRALRTAAEHDNAITRLRARLAPARGARTAEVEATLAIDAPAPPDAYEVTRVAQRERPDLEAARRRVTERQAAIDREEQLGWPQLSVFLGYTHQFQETAIDQPDADSFGLGMQLGLPLFDRNQGGVSRAHAMHRRAQRTLEAAMTSLEAEVVQAVRNYQLAHELLTTIEQPAFDAATAERARVDEVFGWGGTTLDEVIAGHVAYYVAARNHVAAQSALIRALHRVNAVAASWVLPDPSIDGSE